VRLDGRAVHAPGTDRGFVFQNDSLLPWRTVFANAIIGREVAGQVGPAERQRTMQLLKLVGLEASSTTIRASCRAACASASTSPARSRSIRKSC
jgi:ABC-type taurine transport system ATPase subunit